MCNVLLSLAPPFYFAYLGARKSTVPSRRERKKIRHEGEIASRKFIQNLVWVIAVCGLFVGGQLLRYGFTETQLAEINAETDELYKSVLGEDIGTSPFGRLQFEHGKLTAIRRIGLDPLSVIEALSRPAVESVRLEGLSLDGKRGRARGFFGPNIEQFDVYIAALSDDERYTFSLEKKEEVFGGLMFSLIVEAQ